MKTILILFAALFAASASAQDKHMFEFNADSVLQGLLSFDKSKSKGEDADSDTQLRLNLNYAYSLPEIKRIQIGGRFNYLKDTLAGRGDAEDYSLQAGAILNSSNDLLNSAYASLYLGLGWANTYGAENDGTDEVVATTISVGRRFNLSKLGLNHVVYSPEIALQNQNSTTDSTVDYSQNIQFRFLQFSVFF